MKYDILLAGVGGQGVQAGIPPGGRTHGPDTPHLHAG